MHVPLLSSITLAQIPGEDLSPYRAASRSIGAVLARWGPVARLGMDEAWVDVTQVRYITQFFVAYQHLRVRGSHTKACLSQPRVPLLCWGC